MVSIRGTIFLAVLSWAAAVGAYRIGESSYPIGGGAVKLTSEMVHYGRLEAYITGVPVCSGIRAQLAFVRNDHSIVLGLEQRGLGGIAEVRNGSGGVVSSTQWEPPEDPWRQEVRIAIEWSSSLTTWYMGSTAVANFTTPVQNTSAPYQLPHNVSIALMPTSNAGLATTACGPLTFYVRNLTLYSYDQAARTFNAESSWQFTTSCATAGGSSWAGWTNWTRTNEAPAPGSAMTGLLLQSAVNCTAQGLSIQASKLIFPLQANGDNLPFQSPSGPQPWNLSLDGTAVASASYDPYCHLAGSCVYGGLVNWTITTSGVSPDSISASQTLGPLPLASSDTIPEFCLILWLGSTWTRDIAVELSPLDSYFQTAPLRVTSASQNPYSVCFYTSGSTYLYANGDSGVRNVPLTIGFGAVGGLIFHQHVVSLSRAGIWSVGLSSAVVGWTNDLAQEMLTNPGYDDSSAWSAQINTQYGAQAVMSASSGEYRITVTSTGSNSSDLRLFQQNVLLEPGMTYRISMRAKSEGANRLVRLAVWDQDQKTTHGGLMIVQLTTSFTMPFEHTFVAETSTRRGVTAEGTAWVALDAGGPLYNAPSNATVVIDYIHLRRWTGVTLESALPGNATSATPAPPPPPTPAPTVKVLPTPPPVVMPTPAPTPSAAAVFPQTELAALFQAVYEKRAYAIPFENIAVEDIDLVGLRVAVSTTLKAQCGIAPECDALGVQNIEVLSLCYSTLNASNGIPGFEADLRTCRGLGSRINFFGTVVSSHTSYVLFTFVALATVSDKTPPFLATRTIDALNQDLRIGAVSLSGLPLSAQVSLVPDPLDATPVPPGGDYYGLADWQWSVIVGAVGVCCMTFFFVTFFQHGMWKRRERLFRYDTAQAFLEAAREDADRQAGVAARDKGMLPLDKLGMLKRRFDEIDTDGGGTIDKKEFRDMFYRLAEEKRRVYWDYGVWYTFKEFMHEETEERGVEADEARDKWDQVPPRNILPAVHIDDGDFDTFFLEIDKDGNEEIDFTEFSEGFIPYFAALKSQQDQKPEERGRRKGMDGEHGTVETRLGAVLQALEAGGSANTLFDDAVDIRDQELEGEGCCGGLEAVASSIVRSAAQEKHSRLQDSASMKDLTRGHNVMCTEDAELLQEFLEAGLQYPHLQQPRDHEEVLGRCGSVMQIGAEVGEQSAPDAEDEEGDVEELQEMVLVRFQATAGRTPALYWLHSRVLSLHRGNPLDDWLSPEVRQHTKNMERNMVIRAVIAGFLSASLSAVAEMMADYYYGSGTFGFGEGKFFDLNESGAWQYWVIVLVPMVVLSLLEVLWLYRDALLTTMRIARHIGLILYPENAERRFWADALARACLELGHSVDMPVCDQEWGISPTRGTTNCMRYIKACLHKASRGPTAFITRLFVKRLVSRIGAKAFNAYFAVPILMLLNMVVAKLVLHNARVICLAPRLITKLVDCEFDPVPSWYLSTTFVVVDHFEKLRVQVLRAIGCVVVARGEWHPGLEYLYKVVRRKLGVFLTSTELSAIEVAKAEKSDLEDEQDWGEDPADDLTLRQLMRRDCCVHYDMDLLPKLLDALEFKYETVEERKRAKDEEEAREELETMGQAVHEAAGRGHEDYCSEESSEFDFMANTVGFTDEEKKLVLRMLVLGVIVSGRPNRHIRNLVRLTFTRANFTNPGDMIDDLNFWYEDGNLEQVVQFMEKELFLPRIVRQGQSIWWTRRCENCLFTFADW
eukprot:Hpha_TRINITY_DN15788_c5_g1::TRINITY_DN15788_c5_g1_i1::g.41841::m.41841